jgi:peptidoglycan hydrolase-like protein with peptidoglycan-binding domain
VRSEAGARRYGVAIGQAYTEGVAGQEGADRRNAYGATEDPQVQKAQAVLVQLGLLEPRKDGSVHGNFGDKTKAALRAFQKREGLPQTGRVDRATFGRLMRKNTSAALDAPAGDPPGGRAPKPTGGRRRAADPAVNGPGTEHLPVRSTPGQTPGTVPPQKAQAWFDSLDPALQKRVMRRARQLLAARRPLTNTPRRLPPT